MNRKKPSIAYLIAEAQICGGVAVVCQHANRLARRGFGVCIVSTAGDEKIDWFPGLAVPVYPISRIPGEIDIGVATWWETTHALYMLPIPRKFYFVQSDETRFYSEDRYERIFARESYRFNFEFMTEARWLQKWLRDDFGKEAHYVPNGVDTELFHPAEPLEPRGSRPRVLIEGPADMASKGVAEAFSAVRGLDCDVWYVNYRGEPDPSWKPDRYFYRVPMIQMKRIYSSCDILLKLSCVEGSFGPPLEMMACGGACVVARVTGLEEAIAPGENALVVEAGDIGGARRVVKQLLEDDSLRRKLIRGGRATVARLDWEKTIDALEAIFVSLPSRAATTPPSSVGRELPLLEAYRQLKQKDALLREGNEEIQSLRHEINLRNDELNAIRHSKHWQLAMAFKEARHSFAALLKLPVRIIKAVF